MKLHTDSEIMSASVLTELILLLERKGIISKQEHQKLHHDAQLLGTLMKYKEMKEEEEGVQQKK